DGLDNLAVKYDDASKGKVTLGGAGGTVVTNVKDGDVSDGSTDAVNGSQLYAVQAQVNQNATNITLLDGRVTSIEGSISNINNGSVGMFQVSQDHNTPPPAPTGRNSAAGGAGAQASGDDSVAVGNDSKAAGKGGTALGNAAEARKDGDVALGAGAVADRGAESYTGKYSGAQNDSVGTVSVGNAGTGETRTVSNVADGKEATDAVNLRQLDGAVAESKSYTDSRIGDVVNNINNGATGMFQVSQDHNAPAPKAGGKNSVAGGSGAEASGDNGTALGNDTLASGTGSTAVGNGAHATGDNSVALGAGSVADRADSVSVGSAGHERQVTNVAAGTQSTDAVNVGQLKAAQAGSVQYDTGTDGSVDYANVTLNRGGAASTLHNVAAGTAPTDAANVAQLRDGLQETRNWARDYADQRFRQVGRNANAGVASAMAMAGLPQAYEPGKSMASVAASSFRGESSLAVGVSTISESGRWVYKLTGSTNSRGDGGVTVGAGMQW
ncbi:YadA family autotransporter adhesin, partial [Frateuria sp. Soil773]|uniref:YadA family autotransporter adhesin n=1 Tax=Frateuria sp. Soil773 TaxID=1736407 RepID=UPI000A6F7CEA